MAIAFDSSGSQIVLDRCLIRFVSGAANQSQIVKVTATRDFVVDRDQVANLRVKVMPADDPLHWNNHHKIPDVKVCFFQINSLFFFLSFLTLAGNMVSYLWAYSITACAFRVISAYLFTDIGRMDS